MRDIYFLERPAPAFRRRKLIGFYEGAGANACCKTSSVWGWFNAQVVCTECQGALTGVIGVDYLQPLDADGNSHHPYEQGCLALLSSA